MIEFSFSESKQAVTLTVDSLDASLITQLEAEKEFHRKGENHALNIYLSGINKLESHFGETTIWVSYKGWEKQTVTLEGYEQEDVNDYKSRVTEVFALVEQPLQIDSSVEFEKSIELLRETFKEKGEVTEADIKAVLIK